MSDKLLLDSHYHRLDAGKLFDIGLKEHRRRSRTRCRCNRIPLDPGDYLHIERQAAVEHRATAALAVIGAGVIGCEYAGRLKDKRKAGLLAATAKTAKH